MEQGRKHSPKKARQQLRYFRSALAEAGQNFGSPSLDAMEDAK
jgi:hypothetical protein